MLCTTSCNSLVEKLVIWVIKKLFVYYYFFDFSLFSLIVYKFTNSFDIKKKWGEIKMNNIFFIFFYKISSLKNQISSFSIIQLTLERYIHVHLDMKDKMI